MNKLMALLHSILVGSLLLACSKPSSSQNPSPLEEPSSADAKASGVPTPDLLGGRVTVEVQTGSETVETGDPAQALASCLQQWLPSDPGDRLRKSPTVIDIRRSPEGGLLLEDFETEPRLNLVRVHIPVAGNVELNLGNPRAWNCLVFQTAAPTKLTVRLACEAFFAVAETGGPAPAVEQTRATEECASEDRP